MTEALFFLQRDACWDGKRHSVPSLPSFMARDRGYLREGSGSTWSLSPRPRATPNSAAAELAAGTERRQPCCQGLRQLRELGGGTTGRRLDSTPSSTGNPRAGIRLGMLQDGVLHSAARDPAGAESVAASTLPGRLVATAFVGLLY